MKKIIVALFSMVAIAAVSAGCDNVKNAIDEELNGEETALKEPELKNCSRVINCCMTLALEKYDGVVPEAVREECTNSIDPATNVVIDNYQTAKAGLDNLSSEADREALKAQLAEQAQTVEPGCRCFLDQTIGQIPSEFTPTDCEFFEDSGELEDGLTCDDATNALIGSASGE